MKLGSEFELISSSNACVEEKSRILCEQNFIILFSQYLRKYYGKVGNVARRKGSKDLMDIEKVKGLHSKYLSDMQNGLHIIVDYSLITFSSKEIDNLGLSTLCPPYLFSLCFTVNIRRQA